MTYVGGLEQWKQTGYIQGILSDTEYVKVKGSQDSHW